LDVLLSYIASTTLPASRGVVENIVHFEAVGEHGNEIVKLNPKQDIVLINISTDQTEFGWVAEVEKGIASDLEHRGDIGSVQCGMCSKQLLRQQGNKTNVARKG
jgi:hypothetical protein